MKNFKKAKNNWEAKIAIAISVTLVITIPIISGLNPFKDFYGLTSAISGVVTMIFAIIIFDKFDSQKLAFGKEIESVENLTQSLIWLNLNFVKCTNKDLKNKNENHLNTLLTASFYLNWFNIHDKQKFPLIDQQSKVYFTKDAIEKIKLVANKGQNPWIPREITNSLKPIIIFSHAYKYVNMTDDNPFFIVKTSDSELNSDCILYDLSYNVRGEEFKIMNFKDYIQKWEKILITLTDYYNKKFGDAPNFDGD